MSYKSYVLDQLTRGSVLTWEERGKRCWAWDTNGTRYVIDCPCGDGSRLSQASQLGGRRVGWIFENCYVRLVDVDEVPEVVRVAMADAASAGSSEGVA